LHERKCHAYSWNAHLEHSGGLETSAEKWFLSLFVNVDYIRLLHSTDCEENYAALVSLVPRQNASMPFVESLPFE